MKKHPAIPVVAVLTATFLLSACGGGDDEGIVADTAAPTEIPQLVIDKAKDEGEVVVYTNSPDELWNALIPKFEKAYPGVTISAVSLNGPELVQRLRSERAAGAATADLIIDSSPSTFFNLADALDDRTSVYDAELPKYAKPRPGIYAVSADPTVLLYNKASFSQKEPTSLRELADQADAHNGKYATYDIDSENGYAQMWTLAEERENTWDLYDALAPATRYELNGGSMTQKLAQGEYVAGYFQSGLTRGLLKPNGLDGLVGWSYATDGTTVVPRYAAGIAGAKHPNAASLLQDYLLSLPGQTVACSSGLTAVRDEVADTCGDFSVRGITDQIGEDNVLFVPMDEKMAEDKPAFKNRLAESRNK